jgi:hypothetical protein
LDCCLSRRRAPVAGINMIAKQIADPNVRICIRCKLEVFNQVIQQCPRCLTLLPSWNKTCGNCVHACLIPGACILETLSDGYRSTPRRSRRVAH